MLYRFGNHVIDTARFELIRNGSPVDVEPKVLKLLIFLIENRDRVVSRGELHPKLWGRRLVTDNALNVCIRAARRAIDDTGHSQTAIKTIRGAGYRFIANVDCASHRYNHVATVDGGIPGHDAVDPASYSKRILSDQPGIVIIPFQAICNDDLEAAVARGLAHDITTRVARSRLTFVISRGTAFGLASGEHDVAAIGEKLGVRYVVQGAVQVSGERLKVSAALSSALTRRELWSEQYERRLDGFMTIQEEVARTIVASLETEVQREEMQLSRLMPSSNLDAWSAYHRGLHHMYRFKLDECDRAEQFFRRSIDLEPNVPRPYAGLSFIHFERVLLGFDRDSSAGVRKAVDYALESLSIDPLDPMGHWALARAQLLMADLEASKRSLETATDLNPSYAIAQYSLGWVALELGDNEACLNRIDLARRLSPYDPLKFAMLGVYALNLAMMGRTTEAVKLAEESVVQPNAHHVALAFAAITNALDGQINRAREFFRRIRATTPGYDVDDFLAVHAFQKEKDLRRIKNAFREMRPQN